MKPGWGYQLRAGAADQIYELETAKFLNGIRVAISLILSGINDLPAPLNLFPVCIYHFAFCEFSNLAIIF
ncbi:hypothetical protein AYI69_g7829 [Smittium culicis]|uniref:Uncharacterized protein n=1 Tax=Smittium culicis TaxID=133412 RepID=A0A1R1XPB5_9FUNG|nr:hypothetical protein AYI69_g7829 [Smittium culicis]